MLTDQIMLPINVKSVTRVCAADGLMGLICDVAPLLPRPVNTTTRERGNGFIKNF